MATTDNKPPLRTANQIIDKGGRPAKATVTSNVWVSRPGVFSRPTFGNTIKGFVSGADYFNDLIGAIGGASSVVYVAGWQINWDALLQPGVRFYDVVYAAAKRGVKFFVMPWDDANPLQTYETQTKVVLESINARLKKEGAGNAGRVTVMVAKSQSDRNKAYFSHHQKQVVIDARIAYVGGIDIAHGRFDDAKFDLFSKGNGRLFLNSYNPGLPQMKKLERAGQADPDLMTGGWDQLDVPYVGGKSNADLEHDKIVGGAYQVRYKNNSPLQNYPSVEGNEVALVTLREDQPRQPWQDVHARIEGPAVQTLARNFVRRWNSLSNASGRLPMPPVPAPMAPDQSAGIQVLRSAPAGLRADEYKALASKAGAAAPSGVEDDIHTAMKQLIEKSNHFIYIESQFFVSHFGRVGGPAGALSPAAQFIKDGAGGIADWKLKAMRAADDDWDRLDQLPQNGVCAALIQRIQRAILDAAKPKFHVYITLPVHPEGSLLDATVAVQVYWTMQSLAFGSNSLLNGIKRGLKARELRDAKDPSWQRVLADRSAEHESIATEACFDYVTLLNLRNWQEVSGPDGKGKGKRIVTEQVYVHTKLMVVDDLYALLGSANINDRSLLGSRDSELAVLVVDGAASRADVNGKGSNQPVRKFAHELRKSVWNKLFGITGGVRPATELKQAIEQPGSPDSWKLIQRRAEANAELYEAAFAWVPRSQNPFVLNDPMIGASILPPWNPLPEPGSLNSALPEQEAFWRSDQANAAQAQLSQVRGFITALPVRWTQGENIWVRFPTSVIVRNDPATPTKQSSQSALASAGSTPSQEAEQPA
jgi:phospholipase D1/2